MVSRTIALWGAGAAALAITACGGDTATQQTDSSAQSASASVPDAPPATTAAVHQVALPTTPLDRDALFGVTSDTVLMPDPCPFLSDETAIATAKTNYEMIRREVSNEACRWSKNAGFSIRVAIAPLATATPLKDRAYNIDTPPVLKAQPGPGQNAVILYDTAWDTERPYAMGFEQDEKLIEIFVTGMETNADRLTATAEEIATKLPTAAQIDAQQRQVVPALDYCDIWPLETIGARMDAAADSGLRSSPYGKAGCKWNAGYGAEAKSITLARYKKGDTNLDRVIENGGQTITDIGERAVMLLNPPSDGYGGDSTLWVEIDDQQFMLSVTGTIDGHATQAKTLMENILARL